MKRAYTNCFILDGTKEMKPISNKAVLVENDKISNIVSDKKIPEGYEIIDLKGMYLLPGLINLHVHLPASGYPKKKKTDPVKLVNLLTSCGLGRFLVEVITSKYAKTQLLSGTTTIRTVGGVEGYDGKVRDKINAGKKVGPRILAGNKGLSVPGGHMAYSLAYAAENVEQVKEYSNKILETKPDLFKLMITGGVLDAKVKGEPGELKMPPEYVKAACDIAHKEGLKVAAHVESKEGIKVALENGVDTIEHGSFVDENIINLFKEKKAALITTLSPALPYVYIDQKETGMSDVEKFNAEVVLNGIIECSKACLANNIPVGLGTDTGCSYVTHYDTYKEAQYFHKYCDVSNQFALYTITLNNAIIAGIDNETGSIEKGKSADMIVVKNNPLDDLMNLSKIERVIFRGKDINNPKVKKNKKVEAGNALYL